MTMPNRMHGKSGPLKEGVLKICPRCKARYFAVKLVVRNSKTVKVCPVCRRPIHITVARKKPIKKTRRR